ncbi:unnamed protein product [Caenorhabditis nigoni]
MKDVDFDIIENPAPTSNLWKQWKSMVNTEEWLSDDNSVTDLLPSLKSTCSVWAVTKTSDRNMVGSVVWNVYDDICFLGFYLLTPEYRGKGIGSVIWKHAMAMIPKDKVLALRGVLNMVPKYKAHDTPVGGPLLENFRINSRDFQTALRDYKSLELTQKFVRDLSKEEWEQFLKYDQSVTGRDRHEFLEIYYKKLDYTFGIVFYDNTDNIVGVISAVPTGHREKNFLKISPLFANSPDIAFHAMKAISNVMLDQHPNATLVIYLVGILDGSFTVLQKFFKDLNIKSGISGITLYSDLYPQRGDLDKVFIPHNSSCHFDY